MPRRRPTPRSRRRSGTSRRHSRRGESPGIAESDPGLIGNACDIADIDLETGKADEALKLLEPIAKANPPNASPAYTRLMSDLLRSHVGNNQVDLALADMSALEESGGSGNSLTQLYFSLGKLLEKEMDRLKTKGDRAGLNRTQQAYQKFLEALAGSKSGQTYESLEWAGENMLVLARAKEAGEVFDRILEKYGKDPAFLDAQGGRERIISDQVASARSRCGSRATTPRRGWRSSSSSRRARGRSSSGSRRGCCSRPGRPRPGQVAGDRPLDRRVQPLADPGLATGQAARPKPPEYYDAWYHTALRLYKDGKPAEAKKTLASVMRLSPNVGGPEIKAKYVDLLKQIK